SPLHTLSLHDALPIYLRSVDNATQSLGPCAPLRHRQLDRREGDTYPERRQPRGRILRDELECSAPSPAWHTKCAAALVFAHRSRSEEHTSELQSRFDL